MKDVQQKKLFCWYTNRVYYVIKTQPVLVKNFTNNQITVKLGDNESYSIIGAGSWERVFNNIEDRKSGTSEATNIVKVTAVEEGLVEVASVDFQAV